MVDFQCVRGLSACESVHGGVLTSVYGSCHVSYRLGRLRDRCVGQLEPTESAARVLISVIGGSWVAWAPGWRSSPWEGGESWVALASGWWQWSHGCSRCTGGGGGAWAGSNHLRIASVGGEADIGQLEAWNFGISGDGAVPRYDHVLLLTLQCQQVHVFNCVGEREVVVFNVNIPD